MLQKTIVTFNPFLTDTKVAEKHDDMVNEFLAEHTILSATTSTYFTKNEENIILTTVIIYVVEG